MNALTRALASPGDSLEAWRQHLVHRPGDTIGVRLAAGEVETGTYIGLTGEGFLRLNQDGVERVVSGGDVIEHG